MKHQWSDTYGSQWYRHKDGTPSHDDDNNYEWDGFQWVIYNPPKEPDEICEEIHKC